MSAYTTLRITRSKAREYYCREKLRLNDRNLEAFMDEWLEPQLCNAIIVNDDDENDDELAR